ncbi:helix-turn-helix domain-containing protein [Streptomyces sp. NPDC020883]|uniref:MmyB family transcriptional regulator n=1 Tax=unclassified Streptomyces TaxID=2593676 RepID=UPI0034E2063D
MARPTPHTTLGKFLAARRAAVAPHEVGLPAVGSPRRVPGLRREEVALLAKVSVEYYTRLEQGRVSSASPAVLAALAGALRLNADQTAYVHQLGSINSKEGGPQPPRCPNTLPARVHSRTRVLLDSLTGSPAVLLDRSMDILAWNSLASALFLDFGTVPTEHRNHLRMVFLEPRVRQLYRDWEHTAGKCVARLRMEAAHEPHPPRLAALVDELSTVDGDFRRHWARHDVRAITHGRNHFAHPLAGPLTLDWQALRVAMAPQQTLVVYTPPPGDAGTHSGLEFLASWSSAPSREDPKDQANQGIQRGKRGNQ